MYGSDIQGTLNNANKGPSAIHLMTPSRKSQANGPLRFSTATYDAVVPFNKEEGADLAV